MKIERKIYSVPHAVVSVIFLLLIISNSSFAESLPACLPPDGQKNAESIIVSNPISDHDLLARLVYAEGMSTGFGDDQLIYNAIAWGVMNRVRLGELSQSMQRIYFL